MIYYGKRLNEASRAEMEDHVFQTYRKEAIRLKEASLKDIIGKEYKERFSIFLNVHTEISESKLKSTVKSLLKSGDIKLTNVNAILKRFKQEDSWQDPPYKAYDRFMLRYKNSIDKLLSSEPVALCCDRAEEILDYIMLGTKDGKFYGLAFHGDPFKYDIKEISFDNIKSICKEYSRWPEVIKSLDEER